MNRPDWRTIIVRIPPEDSRYPDGWWVHTGTGECIDGTVRPGLPDVPSSRPHAIITAGQRRIADALCEMYAAELWTEAEREAFREMKADGNGGPIFTCWYGAQSSNGSCPLGHRS